MNKPSLLFAMSALCGGILFSGCSKKASAPSSSGVSPQQLEAVLWKCGEGSFMKFTDGQAKLLAITPRTGELGKMVSITSATYLLDGANLDIKFGNTVNHVSADALQDYVDVLRLSSSQIAGNTFTLDGQDPTSTDHMEAQVSATSLRYRIIGKTRNGARTAVQRAWQECIPETRYRTISEIPIDVSEPPPARPVTFNTPERLDGQTIATTPDSDEKAELKDLTTKLLFVKGDDERGSGSLSNFLQQRTGLAPEAEMTALMRSAFTDEAMREAGVAYVEALYGTRPRADALRLLAEVRNKLPPALVSRIVMQLLAEPLQGQRYPDLALRFVELQAHAMKQASAIGNLAANATALKRWYDDEVALATRHSRMRDLSLNDRRMYVWPESFAVMPLEAVPLPDYFSKITGEARTAVPAGVDFQMGLRYALHESLAHGSWTFKKVSYDKQSGVVSGRIQSPVASFFIPFSVQLPPEMRKPRDGETVTPIYRIEPGKHLVIEKFVIEDSAFYTESLVNIDLGAVIPSAPR